MQKAPNSAIPMYSNVKYACRQLLKAGITSSRFFIAIPSPQQAFRPE
jgi:hypothetical protein